MSASATRRASIRNSSTRPIWPCCAASGANTIPPSWTASPPWTSASTSNTGTTGRSCSTSGPMGEHKPEPQLGEEQEQERAEERALFARYKANPTPQGEDRLAKKSRALVYKIVHKFRGHAEPFDDLVQVGTLGLLYAIRRFD